MATESSVSGSIEATVSGWKTACEGLTAVLDGLEVVERPAAGVADPQRLARRRPEPAELPGVRRAALRAAQREREQHGPARPARAVATALRVVETILRVVATVHRVVEPVETHRRRDPELLELAPPVPADPVRRPRRCEHELHPHVVLPAPGERVENVVANRLHGRAAGVRRRDCHEYSTVGLDRDVAQDAEVLDREHRNLWVQDRGRDPPGLPPRRAVTCVAPRRGICRIGDGSAGGGGRHHDAPGCDLARYCISASRYPMCSECTPRRPPVTAGRTSGRVSVASLSTSATRRSNASRNVAGSMATPCSTNEGSICAPSNNSAMYGHSASRAACMRACDSSVPSPRRSTHIVAWSRW